MKKKLLVMFGIFACLTLKAQILQPIGGSISANQTICSGAIPVTLVNTADPVGLCEVSSYQWVSSSSINGPWLNVGTNSVNFTPPALTSTTYYKRLAFCSSTGAYAPSNIVTITVNPLPTILNISTTNFTPLDGVFNVCLGSSLSLINPTAGGVWTSGSTTVATISPTTGIVTPISVGSSQISYTVTSNGCSASKIATVVVQSIPRAPSISGNNVLCVNQISNLTALPTGGSWNNSNSAVVSMTNSGTLTGISGGTSTITYTIAGPLNSTGCSSSSQVLLKVNSLPIVAIPTISSGTSPICFGSGNTVQLNDATPGGVWSVIPTQNQPSYVAVSPTGVVTATSAGGANQIAYTVTINGCSTSKSINIGSVARPNLSTIGGSLSSCVGAKSQLTNSYSGGVWSSTNTSVATINQNGLVSSLSTGTTTIIYTASSATSCTSTIQTTFTVNALPTVSPITGASSVCAGQPLILSDATPNGIWSIAPPIPTPAVATVNSIGIVQGVSGGTAVVQYTVTNANKCSNTATKTITVNDVTPFTILGSDNVCPNTSGLYTVSSVTAGVIYTWNIADASNVGVLFPASTIIPTPAVNPNTNANLLFPSNVNPNPSNNFTIRCQGSYPGCPAAGLVSKIVHIYPVVPSPTVVATPGTGNVLVDHLTAINIPSGLTTTSPTWSWLGQTSLGTPNTANNTNTLNTSGFEVAPNPPTVICTYEDATTHCKSSTMFKPDCTFAAPSGLKTENQSQTQNRTSLALASEIKMYPNPNNGSFTLETDGNAGKASILNALGVVVHEIDLNENTKNYDINMSEKPTGIYLLRLSGENSNVSTSFIVE